MGRIFEIALAVALASLAWNVLALVANWFGLNLPAVDPGY